MPKEDILLTHKSDPKAKKKDIAIFGEKRLPYPVPLKNRIGLIKYPLYKKDTVIFFNCSINYEKRCCQVRDKSSMYALYQHGYFGKGSLSSNAPIYDVVSGVECENKDDFHLRELRLMFPNIPSTQAIVNSLYRRPEELEKVDIVAESGLVDKEPDLVDEQTENLRLSFEEEIWSTFCKLHCKDDPSKFASYYAAYHYFRAKGWVVKPGTKFGCDFTLYKEGPSHYHSLLSVIVYSIKSDQKISDEYPDRTWFSLSPWVRVSAVVAKYPVICVVTIPAILKHEDLLDPRVIQSFTIGTQMLRRFDASQGKIQSQDSDA